MRPHPLAKRYAKALFELAFEKEQLDQVLGEVRDFADLLKVNRKLHAYLYSPEIEKERKNLFLQELLADKLTPLFYHFLLLLIRKGREKYYPEIVFEFNRLYDRQKNRIRVKLTSVVPLDKSQLAEAEKILAESLRAHIVLENKVDESILGGLIVQINGKVIDGSLMHQLETLRRNLKKQETLAA